MNTPVNPSFTIKKGFKGVFITRTCFHDVVETSRPGSFEEWLNLGCSTSGCVL